MDVEGRGADSVGAPRCGPTSRVLRRPAALRKCRSAGTIGGMRPLLLALGVLLLIAGLVWIAQGLNLPFAPTSFMTADRTWVLIGAITAVAGGVLIGWSRGRDPGARARSDE